MIVFRFMLFVILFGAGAYAVYLIAMGLLEWNRDRLRVKHAKIKQEKHLDGVEADMMIEEIKKKTLKDRYAPKENEPSVEDKVKQRVLSKKPTKKAQSVYDWEKIFKQASANIRRYGWTPNYALNKAVGKRPNAMRLLEFKEYLKTNRIKYQERK